MTVNQSLWWESTGNLACWTLKCGLISLSRTRWQCCRLSNERASSSTADSCMWNVQTIKEHIHIDMRWGKQTSSCCGGVGCIWPLSIHILTEMNFFANFWPLSGFKCSSLKKITLYLWLWGLCLPSMSLNCFSSGVWLSCSYRRCFKAPRLHLMSLAQNLGK